MPKQFSTRTSSHATSYAPLAALGLKVQQMRLLLPIGKRVKIAQKAVKDTPVDKLLDALIALLAGAHGIVEVNSRLRADPVLQRAWGRRRCAEQSVIQQTLDACTSENVQELQEALNCIFRQHSHSFHHPFHKHWLLLDVDLSGMPCGKTAQEATKGYFVSSKRNRRGRQLARVLSTQYQEVVTDQLYAGTTNLIKALQPLVEGAERTLCLGPAKRRRTIVRMDAGGGTIGTINWLLWRGYEVHTKEFSGKRAQLLCRSVQQWVDDPEIVGRQVGLVTQETQDYVRPLKRIGVRWRKANGQWVSSVVLSSLSLPQLLQASQAIPPATATEDLLAYVRFYDQRGGGIEASFQEDKQGLGITKRNKKRFAAQQMLMLLGSLAHNLLIWARRWLATTPDTPLLHIGIKRFLRDVWHTSGWVCFNQQMRIVTLALNQAAPWSKALLDPLSHLLASQHIVVILDKT